MSNTQKVLIGVLTSLFVLGGVALTSWLMAVKVTDASWVSKLNEQQAKNNAEVQALNNSISRLESEARTAQLERTAEYLRGVEEGKNATQSTIDELRRTNSGLWLQVQSSSERADSAEAAAVQSERNASRAAQLTTETSEALLRIAADGDAAIKQLGLCQVEYKDLYEYNTKLFKAYHATLERIGK